MVVVKNLGFEPDYKIPITVLQFISHYLTLSNLLNFFFLCLSFFIYNIRISFQLHRLFVGLRETI